MTSDTPLRKGFLLLLAAGMTVVVLILLKAFWLTIVVAAVMAGLLRPFYTRLAKMLGGRTTLASAITVVLTLLVVAIPLVTIGGLVVKQAAAVSDNVRPFVEQSINSPTYLDEKLQHVPGYSRFFRPYRAELLTKIGDLVNATGKFLMSSLSNTTLSTLTFVVNFFLALYAMFFLLIDGPGMLDAVLNHLPLHHEEKTLLIDRFMSITRATIKGTIVIGAIQGVLTGLAFWIVGIPSVAFWTVLLVVLSIIPVIGGAIIWVPACIILLALGSVGKAIGLALFCALVVGSIDNVLRPKLVGRDTKMHDLVILFSTMGGLLVIGPLGFIIGPVLAGLFVTSWQIFGDAYGNQLTAGTRGVPASDKQSR